MTRDANVANARHRKAGERLQCVTRDMKGVAIVFGGVETGSQLSFYLLT
jgi:hypothetical protein